MPYIILTILFLLPIVLFLKKQDALKAFTFKKLVIALNKSSIIYLGLCIGFAFLFAWLENTYYPESNGSSMIDIAAEVAMGFMIISLFAFAPLLLVLNIIKWTMNRKTE